MGSFNRDGVKRRIVEVLDVALGDGWDVSYEWPGDSAGDNCLFFDAAMPGDASPESIGAQPGTRALKTDVFTIDGVIDTAGHLLAVDAEAAAADAMRVIDDTLRRLHRLKDPTGAIGDGTPADYTGIRSVVVTSITGPGAARPQIVDGDDTDDGPISGLCVFTLTCTTDL